MKKFFSTIFLVFVSLYTFGQSAANTSEALFDFTDGSKLNPAVTEEQIPATVTDSVFRSGPISVAFDNSRGSGAPVFWGNYLWMHRGETLMISCPSDYELLRIEFSANTEPGGFSLAEGSKGTFNYVDSPVYWVNEDHDGNKIDGITSVHLYNSNQDSKIRSFTVTYRSPLDDLVTETITPENGSTVNAFDNMTLTFDQEIASTAEYFLLTDGTGTVAYLKPSISGKTVTLKPSAALEENGTYRVSFPKKSFISTEGSYNKAFSTSFTYVIPQNTFNPVSITPADESVEEFPETIEVVFPDIIGNRKQTEGDNNDISKILCDVINAKTGSVAGVATGSLKEGTKNTLLLTVKNMDRAERGIYTITVKEQKVFNIYYGLEDPRLRYNSEFTITYKVAGADAPSEAVLAEARKLLNKTGVGYPKADAAERTALKEAVDAEDKGDEAFRTLMDNFMASTDIDMPEADKYYTIANVQKDGTKYYLAYDGEAVTLTADPANAYSFKAATTDDATTGNVRTFATADGKYLHTLVSSTKYSEASPANVTSEKKAVSSLSLVKMPCQANSEAEQVFGYIAMSGLIGKKYNQGDDITAFSNVLASGNIAEGETSPYFMESLSGAFFFAEAEAPKVITKYTVAINPASETGVVEALESIVVTFPELTAITLADASKISLKGVNTNVVVPVEETPVVKGNTVTIKFGYLPNDTYTFTAAEGAFTYVKDEETVTVQEITTSFTVNYVDEFVYDLDELPNVIIVDNNWGEAKVNPEELNHFSMQLAENSRYNSIETYLSGKSATIIYNFSKTMATGKFVKTTSTRTYTVQVFKRQGVEIGEVAQVTGSTVVLKDGTKIQDYGNDPTDVIEDAERVERMYHMELKLDKVLNAQNCPNGIYWVLIEPATFGDENFGKWVNGEAIAKHECHVNDKIIITVETDNTISGISDVITAPNAADDVIYDLSGRRVNNMTKPGLYIMNGKKFVVK